MTVFSCNGKQKVKVEYPLKEGLKLHQGVTYTPLHEVKVEYPLKQGLNYSLKITTFI